MQQRGFACLLLAALSVPMTSIAVSQTEPARPSDITFKLLPSVVLTDSRVKTAPLIQRLPETQLTGASIAYIRNGKVAWSEGYGTTGKGGKKVNTETLFQAGSISKAVTAVAVMRLVEDGKLDLDADVSQYLKTWRLPPNNFTGKITLRRLLTHTAGFNIHGFLGYPGDGPVPSLLEVLEGKPPSSDPPIVLESNPGEKFSYSGGGYTVVQKVMEDVTGQTFTQVMDEQVLKPLRMTRSSFALRLPASLKTNSALPYQSDGSPWRGGPYVYPQLAAAGLWSTPTDIAKFAIALQESLDGRPGAFLKQKIAKQIVTPEPASEVTEVRYGDVVNSYGFGLLIGKGEHPFFYHEGWVAGFTSQLFAYQKGDGIVVMANGDGGDRLIGDIVRTAAAKYDWPNLKPRSLPKKDINEVIQKGYEGYYLTKGGNVASIFRKGDGLFIERIGRAPFRLLARDERSFLMSGFYLMRGEVMFSDETPSKSLIIKQNEDTITATRISPNAPEVIQMRAILEKVSASRQTPGSEKALRKVTTQILTGSVESATVLARFAKDFEKLVPKARADLEKLGPIRTIKFQGVDLEGTDIYLIRYAHGWATWHIGLTSDEKLFGISYRLQ